MSREATLFVRRRRSSRQSLRQDFCDAYSGRGHDSGPDPDHFSREHPASVYLPEELNAAVLDSSLVRVLQKACCSMFGHCLCTQPQTGCHEFFDCDN